MDNALTFEKRIAVITGATGGLGSTVTRQLAERGASLALLDIDPARLEGLSSSLQLPETRLLARTVDLLSPEETHSAAEAVRSKFGKIDILLHLVGGWTGGKSLVDVPEQELTFMLNQHVRTSFHVIQAFVPHLVQNGWGRIVMISSPSATRPNANSGPYAVGKAGQEALVLALSQELHGTGVTANLLLARTIDAKREKIAHPTPENSSWTTPEELSAEIVHLLGDEAGMINGARIPLYGSY
jgi:NAD(P)-dependent dehydrogenase (short-subunit alcohol dehydrogenase family)